MVQFTEAEIGQEAWNALSLIEETAKLEHIYKQNEDQSNTVKTLLSQTVIRCSVCPSHVAASAFRLHWGHHENDDPTVDSQKDAQVALLLDLLDSDDADVASNKQRTHYNSALKVFIDDLVLKCLHCGDNELATSFAVHWIAHQSSQHAEYGSLFVEEDADPVLHFPEVGGNDSPLIEETHKLELIHNNHAQHIHSVRSILSHMIVKCKACPDRLAADRFRDHWAHHENDDPTIGPMDAVAETLLNLLDGAEAVVAANMQRDLFIDNLKQYISQTNLVAGHDVPPDEVGALLDRLFTDEYDESMGFNPNLLQILDDFVSVLHEPQPLIHEPVENLQNQDEVGENQNVALVDDDDAFDLANLFVNPEAHVEVGENQNVALVDDDDAFYLANLFVNPEAIQALDLHVAVPFNHQCLTCLGEYGMTLGCATIRDLRCHRLAIHMRKSEFDPSTFCCCHCNYVGSYDAMCTHLADHNPLPQ